MSEQERITAELAVDLPPGLDTILGFYDAEVVGLVHAANAFTVREHFQKLINLAKSGSPKVALAALKELRSARREVLELNGFIALMKDERVDPDGNTKQLITHQIARMDAIVSEIANRRNSNGSNIPSPRILEADGVRAERREESEQHQIPQAFPEASNDRHGAGDQHYCVTDAASPDSSDDGEVPRESPLH